MTKTNKPSANLVLAMLSFVVTGGLGCVSGSLATSSGDGGGGKWSLAKRQQIHVGETVEFSF
ncbi:MAG: hypothetical protein GXP29_09910, partial [Planctomycetes bacterium]|nr:hypothetical protein [Planctomycetota bacterium]